MEQPQLRKKLDETTLVNVLIEVNRIKTISQKQMADVFNVTPNYLPPLVDKANEFLEKMSYIVMMGQSQDRCEDYTYVKNHIEEAKETTKYFCQENPKDDRFGKDMVTALYLYNAIGNFCISTENFLYQIKSEQTSARKIIPNFIQEAENYEENEDKVNRYAYRFFTKLLEKHTGCLPQGVTAPEIQEYIKKYIYNEDMKKR